MRTKKMHDRHVAGLMNEEFSERPPSERPRREQPGFYARVYAVVEQIPLGKVTTYGAIAEVLGMKGSSRMVGQALGALPEASEVPAQRVINRVGALSGAHHFGGYERMRSMLRREGVTFKAELVDLEKHFWDPHQAVLPSDLEQSDSTNEPRARPGRKNKLRGSL